MGEAGAQSFYSMLELLFRNPCLIMMFGEWRTGKTDTSLLIMHLARKWGLIDKIASNIYCYDNLEIKYIISMGGLKRWIHADRLIKGFIFDEALTHLPRRRAMSSKNVDMNAFIAELSKGHGRMIFCAQTTKVESTLLDSAFLRAVFTKKTKKVMIAQSKLFESLKFSGLPRSPIRFDKDRLAEFSETEGVLLSDLSQEVKCAVLYAGGLSMPKIARKFNPPLNDNQVKRAIMKVCKAFCEKEKIQVVNQA